MGAHIKISMKKLQGLSRDLQVILDELENAKDNAHATADATGHDNLSKRILAFAANWSVKREAMALNVATIQAIIAGIEETWTEVDGKLYEDLSSSLTSVRGKKVVA